MGKVRSLSIFTILSVVFLGPAHSALSSSLVKDSIQKVIKQHRQATDFHAYWDSGDTPPKLFDRWVKQAHALTIAQSACQIFSQLSQEDLSLFQDAVENHPFAKLMPCQESLFSTVREFYDQARDTIISKLPPSPLVPLTQGFSRETGSVTTLGPSLEVNLNTKDGPIYVRANLDKKHIAFTFDDGPHSRNTEEVLDILEQEKVTATFFMVGKRVKRHPRIANKVANFGHSVGNHTWSHQNLHKTGFDDGVQEIMDGFKALWDVLGFSHPFFRFPYGSSTKKLQTFVKSKQLGNFFWNIDTLDWKHTNPNTLYDYALEQIEKKKRGIILFHDIQPQTVVVLPLLLYTLKTKGYIPVIFRAPIIGPSSPLP